MSKIVVTFQDKKHKKELEAKQQQCDSLNATFELSSIITNGELATNQLQEVKDWLSAKSGFPNSVYSAQLMNIETEFKAFIIAFNAIKHIDDETLSKDFTRTGNTFILSQKYLQRLEESNTKYLSDDLEKVYRKLIKVTKELNEVEGMTRNASNSLQRSYNGIWKVNTQGLYMINSRI